MHWAWGYVAAFAAAATVGGLADWYAVVALFRRPLGLPIPHTAIIPRNHLRIADTLGEFIETNFLAPEPVEKRLGEVDFADPDRGLAGPTANAPPRWRASCCSCCRRPWARSTSPA